MYFRSTPTHNAEDVMPFAEDMRESPYDRAPFTDDVELDEEQLSECCGAHVDVQGLCTDCREHA